MKSRFEGPEESPGFLLWQVSTLWRRQIEAVLATLGLTHAQFVILASVGWLTREGNQVSQVELARHCSMDITMTSQILRTLEKKGYIVRKQRDERSKFPCLTEKGIKTVHQALPLVETVDVEFFSKFKQNRMKLVEILKSYEN